MKETTGFNRKALNIAKNMGMKIAAAIYRMVNSPKMKIPQMGKDEQYVLSGVIEAVYL
jgi:ERCC4-type nuclease